MTIIGIGTDIINIYRIKSIILNYGDNFAIRILSKNELYEYNKNKDKARFISKIFSVKESISKALGFGITKGIYFSQFEIYKNNLGKPLVHFLSKSLYLAIKLKINKIFITISDEKKYVISTVILEK
ncbi:MAG: holo-ACP synthase [Enterobacterales bacterium]